MTEPLPQKLDAIVHEATADRQVPGVAVGVLHEGREYVGAFGVTNVNHPLPVTPDTLFQIGSTSKTFTATAILQLVEQGKVDLQDPVRRYLPDFRLQSEADASTVTVFDLLTHHGGWVGDVFWNTGRGSDAIAGMVTRMESLEQVVPRGTAFSYSNAGFYVLGRIVEVVSGIGFERYIRERILGPLSMAMSFYFPEQTIVHRVVAGHIRTAHGPVVATRWAVPRSIAPGGGLISTVPDQLRWARFHIEGDDNVLTGESRRLMQERHRRAGSMAPWIGLSWMLSEQGGVAFAAHGGATNGHLSSFEFAPARGYACTVLTNSDSGRGLRPVITRACNEHFLGIVEQDEPGVGASPSADLAGSYAIPLASLQVRVTDSGLEIADRPTGQDGPRPVASPPSIVRMTAEDAGAVVEGDRRGETVEFLRDPAGHVTHIRWDGRLGQKLD